MYDVVIIGGGLMGCSAAWQAARDGNKALLIEKQGVVYTEGSSFGEARVTRSLGVHEDIFTYLRELSVSETVQLLDELNKRDQQSHKMSDIYSESPVTYMYDISSSDEVESLCLDDNYKIARTPAECAELFGVNLEDKWMIREFKPNAGTFNPKLLIKKLKSAIECLGGKIQHEHIVREICPGPDVSEVTMESEQTGEITCVRAKKVVVAAGPYTAKLLYPITSALDELLTTKRLYLAFFQLKKEFWGQLSRQEQQRFASFYPVAHMNGEVYYSMIEKEVDGVPLIKVGGHCRRFPIKHVDDIWKDDFPESEVEWSLNRTLEYLNAIGYSVQADDLDFTNGYSCVYTLTPSEVPIVSPLSEGSEEGLNNIVVIAGLSGVGAKGALAYGRIAADYISEKKNVDVLYQKVVDALHLSAH